jgi:hypothetical protein
MKQYLLCFALAGYASAAIGATLTVPGRANPWLAGAPDGASASGGDKTPDNSPVAFSGFPPNAKLQFSVPDTDRAGFAPGSESGPDGTPGFNVSHGAELGIGEIRNSLANALLGVFLSDAPPADSLPIPPLDFASAESRNYLELKPALNQPFYIGNGRTEGGTLQSVIAPAGATRLFLGITDGSGWYNNTGEFHVDVNVLADASFPLTLLSNPPEAGAISATPAPSVNGNYPAGTQVHLAPPWSENFYLQDWTGADSFDENGAQVLMSGPRTVRANFQPIPVDDPLFGNFGSYDCLFEFIYAFLSGEFGDFPFRPLAAHTQLQAAAVTTQPARTNLDLPLIRRFRDDVLERSAEGKRLRNLFYQVSPELIYRASKSSELRVLIYDAASSLQPLVADMLAGTGQMLITSNQVANVKALFNKLSEIGGVIIRSAIQSELARIGPLDNWVGKSSAQLRFQVADVRFRIVKAAFQNARMQFTVTGVLDRPARVEVSNDLLNWTPLGVQITELPASVVDAEAASAGRKFYRVSGPR